MNCAEKNLKSTTVMGKVSQQVENKSLWAFLLASCECRTLNLNFMCLVAGLWNHNSNLFGAPNKMFAGKKVSDVVLYAISCIQRIETLCTNTYSYTPESATEQGEPLSVWFCHPFLVVGYRLQQPFWFDFQLKGGFQPLQMADTLSMIRTNNVLVPCVYILFPLILGVPLCL